MLKEVESARNELTAEGLREPYLGLLGSSQVSSLTKSLSTSLLHLSDSPLTRAKLSVCASEATSKVDPYGLYCGWVLVYAAIYVVGQLFGDGPRYQTFNMLDIDLNVEFRFEYNLS